MKKKLLSLLLATAMVASLAACGAEEAPAADEKAPAKEEQSTDKKDDAPAEAPAIDTSEFVTINYMTTSDVPTNTATKDMLAELNAILKEKVNAELDIYYIGWTDYLSNYNLTLAQMDGTVDLVGTATDWLDAWPNAKNGAFLELSEEMLQTYAPMTWASVPAETWEVCKFDGDIYLMPEDNYAQWTNHGFIYRLDWAKEAGLADGCNSWEDMGTYFKYIKATYPDVVPWDSNGTHAVQIASGWVSSHSEYVPIDGLSTGALWGGTKGDLYTVTSPFYQTDVLVDFAKMMKEWDEVGVWKTDVLNNTTADSRADLKIGKAGADQHHTQTWTGLANKNDATNTIYADDPDAEIGFFWFGKETGNLVALNPTHGAMAVSAASKNPERALMVYDLLRNDEACYRLFNYGQEGRQYAIDENGMRYTPDTYDSDVDSISTAFWWGRNDDLELKSATANWDAIDPLYAEYDAVAIGYPYGQFIPDTTQIQSYIQNCNQVHDTYMKQIGYGKYSGSAEDIVAEYKAALQQAGIEIVMEELQKQLDALYK